MNGLRLDGKKQLEESLEEFRKNNTTNLYFSDDVDVTKFGIMSKGVATFQTNIEFEDRDALLSALCEKVFGAKPKFKE